jgi:acyl carrier protein
VSGDVYGGLRELLAEILYTDPEDIAGGTPFIDLGMDSVLGVEFMAAVSAKYGLQERAGALYLHPNLNALAAYIQKQIESVSGNPLP